MQFSECQSLVQKKALVCDHAEGAEVENNLHEDSLVCSLSPKVLVKPVHRRLGNTREELNKIYLGVSNTMKETNLLEKRKTALDLTS